MPGKHGEPGGGGVVGEGRGLGMGPQQERHIKQARGPTLFTKNFFPLAFGTMDQRPRNGKKKKKKCLIIIIIKG